MPDSVTINGQAAFSVSSAAKLLDMSKPTVYKLMDDGVLAWVRVGADRRITAKSIQRLLDKAKETE